MESRMDSLEPHALHQELQTAVLRCSERGLLHASKWAAEMLTSTAPLEPSRSPSVLPSAYLHPVSQNPAEASLEAAELPMFLLAKAYFDTREFDRASTVLVDHRSSKSKFLHIYSRYMAGEKRREEESEIVLGPLDGAMTANRELPWMISALEEYFQTRGEPSEWTADESWLLYLYGIALGKAKNEEAARKALIQSVQLYQWNWSAWQELGHMLSTLQDLSDVLEGLPDTVMRRLFILHTNQELCQTTDAMFSQLTSLDALFPTSAFLKTERALLHYHARDFEEAEVIFDKILQDDPHRLDSLDHYSNILYVMERRPKLAFLAQIASATDKFRPETCCVIGNYYSLNSEHEKAVVHFRRALTLDRNFLTAWTLMGHEYVEMKNTHAAIESYRRAVDCNRKDYRAWYGLGLSYEVLEMHYYAIYYFQRSASLKPYDPQMWQAMGACFDRMNRWHEAIKAYKRALVAQSTHTLTLSAVAPASPNSLDPSVLYQIGLIYEKMHNPKEGARWMEMCLREEESYGLSAVTGRARLWLAKWEFVNQHWARARELAEELCADGMETEEAKALIRDIRARMDSQRGERA